MGLPPAPHKLARGSGSGPAGADPSAAPDPALPPVPAPGRRQVLVLAALVLGYAALSFYSDWTPDARGLAAGLAVGPVLAIAVFLLWRWLHPTAAVICGGLAVGLLYTFWPAIERNYPWADLAQQCGAYALVALAFGRSLRARRKPLCTQLAETMYGTLTPLEIAYTRRATAVWTAFYVSLSGAILAVFWLASQRVWSLFVNFGTFGLIILAGVVDHAIRRRLLPRHPSGGILQVIQRSLLG